MLPRELFKRAQRKCTCRIISTVLLVALVLRESHCLSIYGTLEPAFSARQASSWGSSLRFRPTSSSIFVTSVSLLRWNEELAELETTERSVVSSLRIRKNTNILTMGKGDGKKKRKKKSALPSVPSVELPAAPAPQRVTNDINISVKHQIRYAQMRKQAAKQAGQSFRQKKVERSSYRRSWDEEEIEQKAEERKRKGQDPDWDVILSRNMTSPLVIVDGYNVIYKWPRLKKHMSKGDPQRARQLLIDDMEQLRSLKGWRIEVVFDGTGRSLTSGPLGSGPGNSRPTARDRESRKDVSTHGVRVVFTGVGIEADSYIEERCAKAKGVTDGKLTGSFIVATDDAMIRMAGQSAGAMCMSSGRLVDELKAVKQSMSYRVEVAVAKANGHAIRPESLRGTHYHSKYGKRQFVIEDKRNRTKTKRKEEEEIVIELNLTKEEENGVPWWAQAPNQTRAYP